MSTARNSKAAPFRDDEAARLVWEAARTRQPLPEATARRLTDGWGDAAILGEEQGPDGIQAWLKVEAVRLRAQPDRLELIRQALDAARALPIDAHASNNGTSPAGPPPFDLGLIRTAEFFAECYRLDWIAKGILAVEQMGVIGGPSKSLKTSILIDLAISIASRDPFLGRFEIPTALRVALISGESGRAVIQANAKQVCRSKAIPYEAAADVFWGFDLPALTNAEHLRVLRKTIGDHGIKVACLDPFYLSLLAGNLDINAGNMYQMGPILDDLSRVCLGEGCTPIAAHHFVKRREQPFEPATLEDLAFSGIGQYVRQWMLLSRRERYKPGEGPHKFTLTYGGSAGHSGELFLDIDTGQVTDDLSQGRKWDVRAYTPCEGIAEREREERERRERREAEKDQAKEEKAIRTLEANAGKAVEAIRKLITLGRVATRSAIADHCQPRLSRDNAGAALALLESQGRVEMYSTEISNGTGKRTVDAYRMATPKGRANR